MASGSTWQQTSEQQYEARDGDTVVATLTRHGASGTKATAVTTSGTLELRRTGTFRTRVIVSTPGDVEVAEVAKVAKAGTVRLDDGGTFVWASQADPKGSWAFVAPDGQPALVFTHAGTRDADRPYGDVLPDPEALTGRAAEVLLALGLFLLALKKSDDDATIIGSLAAVTSLS